MPTQLESHQTILFIGDSITECSRRERDVPLGAGYVRMFADLLTIREPAKHIKVINQGVAGNTADDLRSRWCDHVLVFRPDWLVVKVGINDVNRYLVEPASNPKQSPESFAAIYEQIIAATKQTLPNIRIVIVGPFFLSNDTLDHSYRKKVLEHLPVYAEAARDTASRHGARFIDLQAAFDELMKHLPPTALAEDAVHPKPAGALLIAEKIFGAVSQ